MHVHAFEDAQAKTGRKFTESNMHCNSNLIWLTIKNLKLSNCQKFIFAADCDGWLYGSMLKKGFCLYLWKKWAISCHHWLIGMFLSDDQHGCWFKNMSNLSIVGTWSPWEAINKASVIPHIGEKPYTLNKSNFEEFTWKWNICDEFLAMKKQTSRIKWLKGIVLWHHFGKHPHKVQSFTEMLSFCAWPHIQSKKVKWN